LAQRDSGALGQLQHKLAAQWQIDEIIMYDFIDFDGN
jgi:hypothetical protein